MLFMSKWDELNEAIGRGEMTKRRNAQAVGAWSRHQGAHSPGTKRPDLDDMDDQEQEAVEEAIEKVDKKIKEALRELMKELEEEDDREE
jgi:hypothetical protein